jgi:broad specificity phosphatase PhoE
VGFSEAQVRISTLVTLVRHGETKANADGVFHGVTNTPLALRGLEQAHRVATRLGQTHRDVTALYTSNLDRAQQTAHVIARELDLPIRTDDTLREVDLGNWEGLTYAELESKYQLWERSRENPDFAPHGGESARELGMRTAQALRRIACDHTSEQVIVVGHGGAICSALAVLLATEPLTGDVYFMENAAITELVFEPEPRLVKLNCTFHLEGL